MKPKKTNYSQSRCYAATLAALKELKIDVEKADSAKGLITTERVEFYRAVEVVGSQYSAYGQTHTATHKYYLKISGSGNSSTVTVYRYRMWNNGIEQTKLNAKWCQANVWKPFFDTIGEKLSD